MPSWLGVGGVAMLATVLLLVALALPVAANSSPTAQKVSPDADTLDLSPEDSQEFEIYCSDPDSGDDLRGHWRLYRNGSLIESRDNDADIWGSEGNDAETFTFYQADTYTLQAYCDDENGGYSNGVEWGIITENRDPSITRDNPSSQSTAVNVGDSKEFEISCSDPDTNQDLRSHWRLYRNGSLVDSRDNDADIVGNSGNDAETFSLHQSTTYTLRVACTDENNGQSPVLSWEIETQNQDPSITREAPSDSALTVQSGSSHAFTISCRDPDSGQDLRSHWQLQHESSIIDRRDNDADMVGQSGDDTETFSFDDPGNATLRALCSDESGGRSSEVRWSIHVEGPPAPSASRSRPANRSVTVPAGPPFDFTGKCTAPTNDWGGGQLQGHWTLTADGQVIDQRTTSWNMAGQEGTDTESFRFRNQGTYRLSFACEGQHGAQSEPVQWSITVQGESDRVGSLSSAVSSVQSLDGYLRQSAGQTLDFPDSDLGQYLEDHPELYRRADAYQKVSRDHQAYLERLIQKLDRVLQIQRDLESLDVAGISAWDVLSRSSSSLRYTFRGIYAANLTASQLDQELEEIETAGRSVESSMDAYAEDSSGSNQDEVIESFDRAEPVYREDAGKLDTVADIIGSVEDKVDSVETVVRDQQDIPILGQAFAGIADWLGRLSEFLGQVASNLSESARMLRQDAQVMANAPRPALPSLGLALIVGAVGVAIIVRGRDRKG